MNRKMALYLIIAIIVIIAGIILANKIFKNSETATTSSNISNKSKNMINETNETNQTTQIDQQTNNTEQDNSQKITNNDETREEKVKKIVQSNWGEDDTVYYSYDGIDQKGRDIVCVREKTTTKALYWYYVDLETGTFDIE